MKTTRRPTRIYPGLQYGYEHPRRTEASLRAEIKARAPGQSRHPWGTLRLTIDREQLQTNTLTMARFSACFKDGTQVDTDDNARISARDLSDIHGRSGERLPVRIGLRRSGDRRPDVAVDEADEKLTRFVIAQEQVWDLESDDEPTEIDVLEYNLRVFVGNESTEGYEVLQVARLMPTGDADQPFEIDASYAGPCLHLAGSESLERTVRRVVDRISHVVRHLAEARDVADPNQQLYYKTLLDALPDLMDDLRYGATHPERSFRRMRKLAASLQFQEGSELEVENLPAYDHENPARSFQEISDVIFESTSPGGRKCVRREMDREGHLFVVHLRPLNVDKDSEIYLQVHGVQDEEARRLIEGARTSSRARIAYLEQHAVPGVELDPSERAPGPGLKSTQTAWRVNVGAARSRDEWERYVMPSSELVTLIPDAPPEMVVELLVFPGDSAAA